MKVKIGDDVFDSDEMPIMVILTPEERSLIADMSPNDERFCAYPSNRQPCEIEDFMSDGR